MAKKKVRRKGALKELFSYVCIPLTVFFSMEIYDKWQVIKETQREIAKREKIQEIYEKKLDSLTIQKDCLNDPNYLEMMYRAKNSMAKKDEIIFDLKGTDFWNNQE